MEVKTACDVEDFLGIQDLWVVDVGLSIYCKTLFGGPM